MMLDTIPQTITGPATVNILTHMPKIIPSRLNSIALEQMLFAKPVIGTIVPAPANFAISSKIPIPVRIHVIKIITTNVQAPSSVSDIAGNHIESKSVIACPKQQINPPIKNAKNSDGHFLVFGDFVATYAIYFLFLSCASIISSKKILP